MLNDLKTAKDRVEFLLKEDPSLRDSDKELFLGYLILYHGLMSELGAQSYFKLKKIINDAPSFESIRRSRQRLQEEGKYLGTGRKHKKCEAERVRKHLQVEKAGKLWY